MANKRTLKKAINNVSEELLTDSMFCVLLSDGAKAEEAEELVNKTLENCTEALARISAYPHSNKKEIKTYFNKLVHDFSTEADEVVASILKLSSIGQ